MPKTLGKNLNMCFKKMINSQASPTDEDDHSHFLIKNFNSLYDHTTSSEPSTATPDFASAYASQRFFFSSPGRSNSIVDSTNSSLTSTSSSSLLPEPDTLSGGIAVPTLSPDPYMDFRQSMQDMVEARGLTDVTTNWDNLHELLRCYLSLNPKTTHKYIVRAFADLLISLMTTSPQLKSRNRQHEL